KVVDPRHQFVVAKEPVEVVHVGHGEIVGPLRLSDLRASSA
ncbi:MAG: hypothetical protein ACI8RE_003235, partial [Ilumatobacter sp.]